MLGVLEPSSGQQLVKNASRRVHIGGRTHEEATSEVLFGGHIARGADDDAGARQIGVSLEQLGESEVGQTRPYARAFGVSRLEDPIKQDILRLKVSMDNAASMGVANSVGNFRQ